MPKGTRPSGSHLAEIALLFLKLWTIGFGGPATHIALMRQEVVDRREWLSEQHFLDLVGTTNLIPGPNSTELAIHIGRERAGWKGLLVAGSAFIAPAMVIVLALAWLYVEFGTSPAAEKPAVWDRPGGDRNHRRRSVEACEGCGQEPSPCCSGSRRLRAVLSRVNELLLLGACAVVVGMVANRNRIAGAATPLIVITPFVCAMVGLGQLDLITTSRASFSLLEVQRVRVRERLRSPRLYPSRPRYTTRVANERTADRRGCHRSVHSGTGIHDRNLHRLPLAGVRGRVICNVAIFLPSFLLVAAPNPLIPKIRRSPWLSAAWTDGTSSVALMAGVTVQLGTVAVVDPLTIGLAASSLVRSGGGSQTLHGSSWSEPPQDSCAG